VRKKIPGLLTLEKSFVPASEDDGDELYQNGVFIFNITKMTEYIHEHKDEIAQENIEVKAYRTGFAKLTESHIDTTDILVPIILAEISPGKYNVIDGNHRLEKAYRMGVDYIPAYKLIPEQHLPFLTSLKSYHYYVEYWNSKIKDGLEIQDLT
jgi:hypothetical protein